MLNVKPPNKLQALGSAASTAWTIWRGGLRSRATEAWERAFLREGESGDGYAPPQHRQRVVLLGDSLTEAWPLSAFSDLDVINAGISGNLLSQMRERWRQVLAQNAGIVHLLGGTNNVSRGYSLGFLQQEFQRIAHLAEVSRMRIIIGLLPPMRGTRARLNTPIRETNQWLISFAAKQNAVVADYHSILADAIGELRAEYALPLPNGKLDAVHLNRAAYEAMTPVARSAILASQTMPPTMLYTNRVTR